MGGLPYWDFTAREKWPIYLGSFEGLSTMRINEQIRRSVVFIGGLRPDGEFVPFGTAFLIVETIQDSPETWGFMYLVTAKHVIEDIGRSGLKQALRVNLKTGGALPGALEATWLSHPSIPDLDIALCELSLSNDLFAVTPIQIDRDQFVLSEKYIAEYDIGAGDDVFVIGLLTRHFGRAANIPIVRLGSIAAMPEEPIDLGEYGSHSAYLIEARSIGGLSGSPVYLQTPPLRIVRGRVQKMEGHSSALLLGMNIGLFETLAHADRAPGERLPQREQFLEVMSAGIAVVLPIQRVIEILNHPQLTARKEEGMKQWLKRNTGFVPTSARVTLVSQPTTEPKSDSSENGPNPDHKEDFTRLLGAAVKGSPSTSQT